MATPTNYMARRERLFSRFGLLALVAALLALTLPAARPAFAGSIVVNVLTDHTPVSNPLNNDDKCSLREAIQAANFDTPVNKGLNGPGDPEDCPAGSGADTITFSSGGTIKLEEDIFVITEVTINGPITISGGGTQRIFRVTTEGVLSLNYLTLQDGFTTGAGAAILQEGAVVNATAVSFQNNIAGGNGGAINSTGALNILLSTFSGNKANGVNPDLSDNPSTGQGGAIWLGGADHKKISLTNFSGNIAGKSGGAIYNSVSGDRVLQLSDVVFNGNIANGGGDGRGGGAVFNNNNAFLYASRTAFTGNLSPNAPAGALFNNINATAVISDTSFNANVSGDLNTPGNGGAIYNEENLTIVRSTFNGNIATAGGGAGEGGGIANNKAALVKLTNSSFFANMAVDGKGGAIINRDTSNLGSDSTFELRNSTFSSNNAQEGGAIFNDELVSLRNTIIDQTVGVGGTCAGAKPVTDDGHNLQFPGSACGATIDSKPALLEPPSFNGGAIATLLTQALMSSSPAIDAGDDAVCSAAPVNNEDQRGEDRPKNGDTNLNPVCDIGAFEADTVLPGFGSTPVDPGPINFGSSTLGTPLQGTLKVFETGNLPLTVLTASLEGDHPGDFSIQTSFPLVIPDSAPEQVVDLACTPTVVGQRSAKLRLTTDDPKNLTVTYDLLCTGTEVPVAGFGSTPIMPGPLDFGTGLVNTTLNTNLLLQENGTADLTVSDPTISGLNASEFKVLTAFPITIANGAGVQTVQLSCTPGGVDLRIATLTLTTNDPAHTSVSFSLTCKGKEAPSPLVAQTQVVQDTAPSDGLGNPYRVVISPDGKYAYVTGHGDDAISVFSRDPLAGTLSWVETEKNGVDDATDAGPVVDGLDGVYGITISPDGKNVYGAGYNDNAVAMFSRDSETGKLSFIARIYEGQTYICAFFPNIVFCPIDGLAGAYWLESSADGNYVYVSSINDDAVVVLQRNQTNGQLVYRQTLRDGVADGNGVTVDGMDNPRNIAIAPDGGQLYVAAASDDALTVFKRDAANGLLSFVETQRDNTASIDGLDGAFGVALSPDGTFVYVGSVVDSAVAVFKRNLADGKLSFVAFYKDGDNGIDGLGSAGGLATSPDGAYLYATGFSDSALAIFERSADGTLAFRECYKDGQNGVDGMLGARDVTVGPDGRQLYVTAYNDGTVAVFGLANPKPLVTSLSPASVAAGSPDFNLVVYGAHFVPGSRVYWNGAERTTIFVNEAQLKATIPQGEVATSGTATVSVVTPTPGGGTSDGLNFTISAPGDNPIPSIATISPAGAAAGDGPFTLTVNGSNFIASSKVQWNGQERSTTYINGSQLKAAITASDIAAGGPAGVTVFNGVPGGGASNVATFTVAKPGENPVPSITSLSPASVLAGGAGGQDFLLTVNGTNFIADSDVYWNGELRITKFVSETLIQVTVTAADIASGQPAGVTVFNPAPGGGTSNVATFTVAKPGENLVPEISGIVLQLPPAGGITLASPAFVALIDGSNFSSGMKGQWNGADRDTVVISQNQATMNILPEDLLGNGLASITVTNPPPGGGTSAPMNVSFFKVALPLVVR